MATLIRAKDWSKTPLGPVDQWPQSLRTTVSLCLASNFPINIIWGADNTQIYNDGYRLACGEAHPSALGQDYSVTWASAWPAIGDPFARALAGQTSFLENQRMFLTRNGYLEETFFTFSLSPIRDESGGIGGLFHPATETTAAMLAERRLRALRDVTAALSTALNVVGLAEIAVLTLAAFELDLPFLLLYEFVAADQHYRLVAHTGVAPESIPSLTLLNENATAPWPVAEAVADGLLVEAKDIASIFQGTSCGPYEEPPDRAFLLPIGVPELDRPPLLAIVGISPRLPLDDAYRGHYELLSAALSAALVSVRAHEGERRRATRLRRVREERLILLAQASAGLLEAPDPEVVLGPMLAQGAAVIGFDRAYIFSVAPDGAHLCLTHSVGITEETRAALAFVPFSLPLCGIVAETGLPLIIEDVLKTSDPRYAVARKAGIDAYASFPIISDDRVAAVMSFCCLGRSAFTTEELDLLATLARFASVVRQRLDREASLNERIETRTAELRDREEQLRQSQKLEAIGQLTGGVAHDFNNLLTIIRSSVDLLKRPDLPDARKSRYIGAISETVERAAKLTGQLLAFARRQALKPQVFAACDSVRTLSDMLRTLTGPRINIVTELPAHRCFVNADPIQYDTALLNMAINARDAMNDEGQLTIKVAAVEAVPAASLHPVMHGDFVAVSISDTGRGIPPDQLEQIFEPFFTTKATGKGTGLGLSQVFGFAKQSGGEINVESRVGEGSRFTIFLPQVAEVIAKPDQRDDAPSPLTDGHGISVLIVEDNLEIGHFATQTLSELGYHTVWAAAAEQALAELAADAGRFDVVFSDVLMPGMNGIELGQQIRRDHDDLPVVLTSGYSHVLAQSGPLGFELLHKPYSIEELSHVLRKAATRRRNKRSE